MNIPVPTDGQILFPSPLERYAKFYGATWTTTQELAPGTALYVFGPHENSLPSPVQLQLQLRGEYVDRAELIIGWSHQAIEKQCENVPFNLVPEVLRFYSPENPVSLQMSYFLALEKLLDPNYEAIDIRDWWLMVILESCRIREHLATVERLSSLLTARAFKALERCKTLSRKILELAVPGDDLIAPLSINAARVFELTISLVREIYSLMGLLPVKNLSHYLAHKGNITCEKLIGLGITGPSLKASGHFFDLRVHQPCLNYASLSIPTTIRHEGDAFARYLIRLDDAVASCELILSISTKFPQNTTEQSELDLFPLISHANQIPVGTSSQAIESAEGTQAVTIVSDGQKNLHRMRIRTPHFSLASAVDGLITGTKYQDILPIIHSLGVDFTQADR